jgi:hypothetical protein
MDSHINYQAHPSGTRNNAKYSARLFLVIFHQKSPNFDPPFSQFSREILRQIDSDMNSLPLPPLPRLNLQLCWRAVVNLREPPDRFVRSHDGPRFVPEEGRMRYAELCGDLLEGQASESAPSS